MRVMLFRCSASVLGWPCWIAFVEPWSLFSEARRARRLSRSLVACFEIRRTSRHQPPDPQSMTKVAIHSDSSLGHEASLVEFFLNMTQLEQALRRFQRPGPGCCFFSLFLPRSVLALSLSLSLFPRLLFLSVFLSRSLSLSLALSLSLSSSVPDCLPPCHTLYRSLSHSLTHCLSSLPFGQTLAFMPGYQCWLLALALGFGEDAGQRHFGRP